MSSTTGKCSMCQKSLGKKDRKDVATACGHTFHRDCAEQRLVKAKSNDCPICRQKSALLHALTGDATTAGNRRDFTESKTTKSNGKVDHATPSPVRSNSHSTSAHGKEKHENEWQCSKCASKNSASASRCELCSAPKHSTSSVVSMPTIASIVEEPYDQILQATTDRSIHHHHRSTVLTENDRKGHRPIKVTTDDFSEKHEKANWECDNCSYHNENSSIVCINCKHGKTSDDSNDHATRQLTRIPPPIHRSSFSSNLSSNSVPKVYPDLDSDSHSSFQLASDRPPLPKIAPTSSPTKEVKWSDTTNPTHHSSDKKPQSSSIPSASSHPQRQALVYISDLPLDMQDDRQLETTIRHRVEKILKIELNDIKCYSKLGVGVIRVSDKQTKDHLIKVVEKLALNSKEGKNPISFVETLELVSYIVLDVPKEMKDVALPSTEEISRRWAELYKGEKPLVCEQLNTQFPNIYRLVSTSLDELIRNMHHQDFSIKNQFARIYFCADCSFLEDLPRSITQDQLEATIVSTIKQSKIPSSSLYIQLNKQARNACIITTDIARQWSTISYLYLEGKPISKKDNLTCRLRIYPVPQTFAIGTILHHQELAGKIITHKHIGENLILEISDKNVFDECSKRGALRIGSKQLLHMEAFTASNNPEGSEIDGDTWYETEMLQYKPDIMQFVANPEHVIFRYKWNPQIWLEQFKQLATLKRTGSHATSVHDPKNITADQMRHQLQVTVMLNTLGSIRNQSYSIGDRKVKLSLNTNVKTIVYNHQSKLEKGEKMPLTNTRYSKTVVHVVKDDCMIVYEELMKKGKRPLLLNMASATSPGGGFRKGDGAQEENLFRRSDYFRSLDIGLDDFLPQKTERLHYSSNAQLDSLTDPSTMYPMDEYGAIYTSGLTFFRHSQDTGYAYMEKPLENVCSVAMAAYRDPKLEGNMLAPKYAVGTRKKIENIFNIAFYHKHDCIVLSALGCGAFRNPPTHIAKLFWSVIDQYAGFFESITFAIVDDHNAGQKLNPDGNFKPFADVLDGKTVQPIKPMDKANTMFGPYRLLSDGARINDICIYDLTPCNFGAKCNDTHNPNHTRQFSHPPLCARSAIMDKKCDLTNDIVHMVSFIHRNQCQYGGECRQIADDKHAREVEHPSYCPEGGYCHNMEEGHLKQYRHLPLCKAEQKCLEYQKHVKKHCETFRHCKRPCPHGNYCVNFHNKEHINELQHPFPTPCPHTPFHCPFYNTLSEANDTRLLSNDIQQHCLDYAHVCRYGRNCTDNTQLHREKSIHIARCLCRYGDKCLKVNQEEHLNSFTHPKIHDIRRVCKHASKCHERRKIDHISRFRHAISHEDSGVVRYYALNNDINFVENQSNSIARVLNYVKSQDWKPLPSGSVPQEILDWFRTVQPVHRCNPIIFESILLHGHVMSREYMEHLKKPKFVANSVMQHSRVLRIENLYIPQIEQHARQYITAIVSAEYDKADFLTSTPGGAPAPPRPDSISNASIIKAKENLLLSTISQKDLNALKGKAIEIAQASIKLHSNPAGIGHLPDKALGTDKHVFSILGPHLGHYYGDVFIVFKREILHHPDADFSIQAATSFASGNAYKWRPWLGADPGTVEERINLYHHSKLHASIPGYEYAIALEYMALTSYNAKSKSMDIDLEAMFKHWVKVDSHSNIEAHLPQLIPLDYIDHIYIPKNIFDSLNASTLQAINAVFKHCITVTPHQGEASQPAGPFGSKPESPSRVEYQDYVVEELFKQFKHNAQYPSFRPIQGAIITIPGVNFNDSFLLPLTISQAREQYRIDHQQPPSDNIAYIYWQVMNGDMMVVLSNEQINSTDQHQPQLRCLVCYIAPKCTSRDSTYYEQATYLNCGLPVQHPVFVTKNRYKAKSHAFHVGCNTDDFLTYCLEINFSNGKVTLRHAGSNSIYNHEQISCVLSNAELDLSKLEFVSVTAGSQIVSVRNLMVCFEKQADLHPTFDENFKKSTTTASARQASESSPKPDDDSAVKSKGFRPQVKDSIVGGDSSSLKPCPDNINCLLQYATDSSAHNSEFSHPCRFSELCRTKESHLTHEPRPSPLCSYDKSCNKLTDPYHRAENRHTNLPDFLIPCRYQAKCREKSNEHRIRYSHGEQILGGKATATYNPVSKQPQEDHRYPCKWGSACRTIGNANHRAKYSHPEPQE